VPKSRGYYYFIRYSVRWSWRNSLSHCPAAILVLAAKEEVNRRRAPLTFTPLLTVYHHRLTLDPPPFTSCLFRSCARPGSRIDGRGDDTILWALLPVQNPPFAFAAQVPNFGPPWSGSPFASLRLSSTPSESPFCVQNVPSLGSRIGRPSRKFVFFITTRPTVHPATSFLGRPYG
jgi:hypothetical protein